jgi:succinoglycan biosynthesis transport protein ExoP
VALSGYLSIARRWWWTLLVAVWVAALLGYLVASRIEPTYESRTKLLVGPINTDVDTLRASGQLVQTYAELVTSGPILESTIKELSLPYSAGELRADIRTTADDVTRFLTIRVQDGLADRAADIANTLASELIQVTSSGTTRPEGQLQVTEYAEPSGSPVAPQVSLIVLVAAAVGLTGALLLVVIIETVADTIRSKHDLARSSHLPIIGTVPRLRGDDAAELLAPPGSSAADAYRVIGATLALGAESGGRAIALVSAEMLDDDGRVVANLADAISVVVDHVVVLDGRAVPGSDAVPLRSSLGLEIPRIVPGEADGALDVAEARGRIKSVAKPAGTVVLIDAGSVHGSSSALVWARAADAVVLVAQEGKSHRGMVASASDGLRRIDANVVGAVLIPWLVEGRRGGLRARLRGGSGGAEPEMTATVPADDASAAASRSAAGLAGRPASPTADGDRT